MPESPEKQPVKIEGKNWVKEVQKSTPDRKKERNDFYTQYALRRLRLRNEIDSENTAEKVLDKVLDNPEDKKYGLKNYFDLYAATQFSRSIMPKGEKYQEGKGWTLGECLDTYFDKNIGVTDRKQRRKEIALTLYYLKQQGVNVDDLKKKSTVEIKAGQLFITDGSGNKIVDGAFLRKLPGETGLTPSPPPEN